jgi:galactokinase
MSIKESSPWGATVATDRGVTGVSTGRLDIMGGIADYSGSLVLQMPIQESTSVSISKRSDNRLIIKSLSLIKENIFETEISQIPYNYDEAKAFFKQTKNGNWAAYVAGCLVVLRKEKGILLQGFDIEIRSDVPNGKGVSSSAALEVATMKALQEIYQIEFSRTELPVLAQKVENLIVGAPCGLMDQLASYFGVRNHLLPITCQPDMLHSPIKIPQNLHFIGIDSGIRHAVSGASYGDVRTAAFMGYTMIAQRLGVSKEGFLNAKSTENRAELPYNGYLANISVTEFENRFEPILKNLSGKDFLEEYGEIIDSISTIQPNTFYDVIHCTKHPIYENERVTKFKNLIENFEENHLEPMGKLMYESHESYSKCGLGNEFTDKIVKMAKELGTQSGIYGAKITGGGSGGTVCVLAFGEKGKTATKGLFEDYKRQFFKEQKLCFFE